MTDKIRLTCPVCGLTMLVPLTYAGKKVRCKRCQKVIPIELPIEEEADSEEDAEASETDLWGNDAVSSYGPESSLPPRLVPKLPRVSGDAPTLPATSTETCPFPGAILSHFLISDLKQGFLRSPSGFSQIVGFGYAGMSLLLAISTVIMMVKIGGSATSILITVLTMLMAGVFVIVLHYANHTCEQLVDSLLQIPKFYVSSMGHLQLAAIPFILLAIAVVISALPIAVSSIVLAFSGFGESTLGGRLSGLLMPLLMILLGISSCRLFLGVLLNPAKVGIEVKSDTSSAETTLAISAAVARAPLSIVRPVHQSGVVAGCLGAIANFALAIGLTHELVFVATVVCMLWCFGALLWPILSYIVYLISMFGIEILQSFFKLVRHVSAIDSRMESGGAS